MKGLRVTKLVKEIKFEEFWGELDSKKVLQSQSFTKYVRLNLVLMWNSAPREKINFCFSEFFASIKKFLILTGRLDTRLSF